MLCFVLLRPCFGVNIILLQLLRRNGLVPAWLPLPMASFTKGYLVVRALVRVVAQETPEPNVSVDRMMIGTPQPTVWVRCVFSLGPDLNGVSYHTDLTDHRGDRIATPKSPRLHGLSVRPPDPANRNRGLKPRRLNRRVQTNCIRLTPGSPASTYTYTARGSS